MYVLWYMWYFSLKEVTIIFFKRVNIICPIAFWSISLKSKIGYQLILNEPLSHHLATVTIPSSHADCFSTPHFPQGFLLCTLLPLCFYLRNSVSSSIQDAYFPFILCSIILLYALPSPCLALFLTFTICKSMFAYIQGYSLLDLFCLPFIIFIIFPQPKYKILEGWPWIFCCFVLNTPENAVFVCFNQVKCQNNPENVTVNVEWAKNVDTIFECGEQWTLKMTSKLYYM